MKIIKCLIFFPVGIDTVVVPIYLSEIAPTRLRGALGSLHEFGAVFGVLISYILGLHQVLMSILNLV